MTNFGKPINEESEKEILWVVNNSSAEFAQVAMGELTRRKLGELDESLKKLDGSIKKLDKSTSHYSKIMIFLSVVLFIVTLVQLTVSSKPLGWIESSAIMTVTGVLIIWAIRKFSKIL